LGVTRPSEKYEDSVGIYFSIWWIQPAFRQLFERGIRTGESFTFGFFEVDNVIFVMGNFLPGIISDTVPLIL
jgi:hypothetical protein